MMGCTQWCIRVYLFFFNDTATTEIYTLSLHDALPISACGLPGMPGGPPTLDTWCSRGSSVPERASSSVDWSGSPTRSEEHTSELQSRQYLVCRLLLEKKKDFRVQFCA